MQNKPIWISLAKIKYALLTLLHLLHFVCVNFRCYCSQPNTKLSIQFSLLILKINEKKKKKMLSKRYLNANYGIIYSCYCTSTLLSSVQEACKLIVILILLQHTAAYWTFVSNWPSSPLGWFQQSVTMNLQHTKNEWKNNNKNTLIINWNAERAMGMGYALHIKTGSSCVQQ